MSATMTSDEGLLGGVRHLPGAVARLNARADNQVLASPDDRAVCVIGAGYVGMVTGVCLALAGRQVRLVEIDPRRLSLLAAGRSPIHEPGLDEALAAVIARRQLRASSTVREGVVGAGIVLVAVGTPPLPDGNADLTYVRRAVQEVAACASPGTVIALKSTVPPGTTVSLRGLARRGDHFFPLVTCPEFLREGSAMDDFQQAPRIVVGGTDEDACARVVNLFAHAAARCILTDPTSAEMIKYGANAFLALKISFINEIAHLCELAGADVDDVADGIGSDPRIGRAFLNAGLGFGGSCFPKDVRALDETATYHGENFWLLKAAIDINVRQRHRFARKVQDAVGGRLAGRRVAILGLAFKPGTDDIRQAASIDIIRHLHDLGARITATDPVALGVAAVLLPGIHLEADEYRCVEGADCVVLITEWPQYRHLDWERVAASVRRRVIVDGRNALDGHWLREHGFTYISIGRRPLRPAGRAHRRASVGTAVAAAM